MSKVTKVILRFLMNLRNKLKRFNFIQQDLMEIGQEQVFSGLDIHEKMLADQVRTEAYRAAIEKYVKPSDVVVDLGAGTGILSFLAAQKKPKKIFALEKTDIIEKAKLIAKYNKIDNIIFIKKDSRKLTLPKKANIILHDQIGNFLFNEGMVSSVIDLKDRLLLKEGKILPGKFELFIEPVKIKDEYHIPFLWEQEIDNIKFDCLKQYKDYFRKIRQINGYEVERLLSEPKPVMTIDLETVTAKDLPKHIYCIKKINANSRFDGFCLYFKAIFDDEIYLPPSKFVSCKFFHVEAFIVICTFGKHKLPKS